MLALGTHSRARASAPISRCAAASTCPNISAAAPRSRSDNSAATAAAHCAPATCCGLNCRAARTWSGCRAIEAGATGPNTHTRGRSASSTDRMARRTSSPPTTSTRSSTPNGKCTTTRAAPACGSSGRSPPGRARDGGEAGLHPSNIHDNAYAIGSVDFTGDMPVILGPDGPSLGGFVCPVTIVDDELWKIGQLRPGDKLRFRRVARSPRARAWTNPSDPARAAAPRRRTPDVCVRRAGESNLLVEFGAPVLDLVLRFQVQALLEELRAQRSSPGRRPDARHPLAADPLRSGARLRKRRCSTGCWRAVDAAAERRSHAPARAASCTCRCPGTIRRRSWPRSATSSPCAPTRPGARTTSSSSGASTASNRVEAVRDIVFGASYLVMGLGDVYLGAPVATPLDPRHRLVTTKYNPARTWTPENAVGIGGAYLCVYGMEGPGGYQFVGRTVQMWNRYRQTARFPRRQAVAAALLRPDPLLSGERRRTAEDARGISLSAAIRCASRSRISTSASTWNFSRNSANPSTRSGTGSAALSMRSASAGAPRALPKHRSRRAPPGPRRPRCQRIASRSPRRSPAACGRSRWRPDKPSRRETHS